MVFGFFKEIKEKLSKSKDGFFGSIKKIFSGKTLIDNEMCEELEDLLIQSDVGMEMTLKIVDSLEKKIKENKIRETAKVWNLLREVMEAYLVKEDNELKLTPGKMNVILITGVNGVGKTTTIGKLAYKFKQEKKKVIIGAADTFRAAAIEQLEEWAKRSGAELVKHTPGADPGAVVFDTIKAGKNRGADVVIIDTAGRLHNKSNLMAELTKINKIIKKELEDEYYESLLVIDGTTGQNALTQAKVFNEVTNLTGFVITKMDGTSKGGVIFAISEEIKKPVKFIGIGEGMDDLKEFEPESFVSAMFED